MKRKVLQWKKGYLIEEEVRTADNKSKKSDKQDWITGISYASELGFIMVTPVVICLFIGIYLDRFFSLTPILTMLFIILGVVIGFTSMMKIAQKRT